MQVILFHIVTGMFPDLKKKVGSRRKENHWDSLRMRGVFSAVFPRNKPSPGYRESRQPELMASREIHCKARVGRRKTPRGSRGDDGQPAKGPCLSKLLQ